MVRLQSEVSVYLSEAEKCLLKQIFLEKGSFQDFGIVTLRQDKAIRVRLSGVWAKEGKDVWWLATNLKLSLAEVVALYDRRMSVEEQFRDAKGARFGVNQNGQSLSVANNLERIYLLVGAAMLLWTAIGSQMEKTNPKVRLRSKKKGARISLLRIGIFYWQAATKRAHLTMKFVKANLPKPKFRYFQWLVVSQN